MKKNHTSSVRAVVAGVAALSAAAVGAYYLYGHKDAKKHRAQVKGWMLKAKGDLIDELEKAKEVTQSSYATAVDTIASKYRNLKEVDPAELETFIMEMRDHWGGIKKSIGTRVTGTKKQARKAKTTSKKHKKASE